MRIAVLIIGLLLGLLMSIQSIAVAMVGAGDDSIAGAIGVIAAVLWLSGCGFVMGFPKVSANIFLITASLCLLGATIGFGALYMWSIAALSLMAMSSFGWREKRKEDYERSVEQERQCQRDMMLERMMQKQG